MLNIVELDLVNNMRHFLPLLFVVSLAGCSASAKYDIDVECVRGYPYFEDNSFLNDDKTTVLVCYAPVYFEIKCKPETLQEVGDERFCSTHDGKSVRVNLFNAE
ncbi:MAG: hypothetical protein PHO92_03865 [Candidatus Peribacteraceae bacterium]|nr:hypothetical protein [Candidatus Peribacteraceae bacterium]